MKKLTKTIGGGVIGMGLFLFTFFLHAESDENSFITSSLVPTAILSGGSEDERTERIYSFSLLAPNQSSIQMNFVGGQRVEASAVNNGLFGATLNWQRNFVTDMTIFAGILLPTQRTYFTDGIFGEEPLFYRYSASTASDVSHLSFRYNTKY